MEPMKVQSLVDLLDMKKELMMDTMMGQMMAFCWEYYLVTKMVVLMAERKDHR